MVPKIREEQLMTSVTGQMEQYADFTRRTEKLMRLRSEEPEEPGLLKKAATKGGIMMNMLFDLWISRSRSIKVSCTRR